MNNLLDNKKHIHFIGIGGSGMYPLAQILHKKGYFITGSDNNQTDTLATVKDMGISVFLGHDANNILGADLIVYTAAIMDDNVELIAAKNSNAVVIERSILLGIINNSYEKSICVSGTHGKTTVTGMISQIFFDAKKDPTCVIGGKLKAIGGSGRVGKSEHMICEACEFKDTFLQLNPYIGVILNIDNDHMDYFKTMDNLINSFIKFSKNTKYKLIINGDDKNCLFVTQNVNLPFITVGSENSNDCDYFPRNIKNNKGTHQSFTFCNKEKTLGVVDIFVPGIHNVYNACFAIAAALEQGVTFEECVNALKNFHGTKRRFEILANINNITIADDYAHHPKEISVTLKAAKKLDFNRIIAVHQPFTYSRTYNLLDDFAKSLKIADIVVLTQIMGSREKNTYGITTKALADKIPNCVWFETFEQVSDYVKSIAQEGDLIITLGCGDVYKAANLIIEKMQ